MTSINESNIKDDYALSLVEMQDKLDHLWEKHLELLDQYHQAQTQLQKHMSKGFFSLAQASFKSPTRMRYGQDYYDDRTQATRTCTVSLDSNNVPITKIHKFDPGLPRDEAPSEKDDIPNDQMPTPPATPNHQETGEASDTQHDKTEPNNIVPSSKSDDKQKKPIDPLHWYGILVPPPLRQAQSSFIAALRGPVENAANAAQAMRRLEIDIRRLRKEIKKAEKKAII